MSHVVKQLRCVQAVQPFTVPAGVSSIQMELWGASEGGRHNYSNMASHAGVGYVSGVLPVSPGDTYNVYVGGAGQVYKQGTTAGQAVVARGGYNGGGDGGYATATSSTSPWCGAAGGGATDVRTASSLSSRILVAGGQGGTAITLWWGHTQSSDFPPAITNPTSPNPPYAGTDDDYYFNATAAKVAGQGGYGGSTTGAHGGASVQTAGLYTKGGGSGGSQKAGGLGGAAVATHGSVGTGGVLGTGGKGGAVTLPMVTDDNHHYGGGGGGGGYYGGGGGASDNGTWTQNNYYSAGGGGGGSNYVGSSFTSKKNYAHTMNRVALTEGVSYYDGLAIFTYDQPPNTPNIVGVLDGQFVDATQPFEIQWEYASPDNETYQYGFEVDYQIQGAGSWTAYVDARSSASSYTFPAGTFTPGTLYTIRMRYYDNTGDPSGFFTFGISPQTPNPALTITSPTEHSTVTSSPFNVVWTPPTGTTEGLYSIQIVGDDGTVLFTNNEQSSTRENFCWSPNCDYATSHTDPGSGLVGMDNWYVVDNLGYGVTLVQSAGINARGLPTSATAKSFKVDWGDIGSMELAGIQPSDACWITYDWLNTVPGRTYNVTIGYAKNTQDACEVQLCASAGGSGESGASSTQSNWFGDTTDSTVTFKTWQWLTLQFVATTTITYLQLIPIASAAAGANAGFFDACLVEQGANNTPVASLAHYFDGGNANGQPGTASWENSFGNGVTGNGTSQLAPASPVSSCTVDWASQYGLNSASVHILLKYVATNEGSAGAWSQTAQVDCQINMSPPATPVVSLLPNNLTGSVTLQIQNPTGSFATVSNDVYRTDLTNGGEEVRIATNLPPNTNYVDYTPATMTVYQYRVRAYSQLGGFADAT